MQVWELLQKERSLYVREDSEKYSGYIAPAYRWLQEQLATRLPAHSGHLPWWAHCQKPDLRFFRHVLRKGETEIRLELEIAEDSLVRFPCWAWDKVYCQDYLAETLEEYEAWTAELQRAVPDEDTWPLPQPWRSRLELTWQRLFDPDVPLLDWDPDSGWSRSVYTEAVFEVLRLDEVRRVTPYRGTCSLRRRRQK